MSFAFKETYTLSERRKEADNVMKKYPQRVPVIVELSQKSTLPPLDKTKFLVPEELTVGQLSYVIRKRMSLRAEQAIFLTVNGMFPSASQTMQNLYKEHHSECGFLYIHVTEENTFG